MIRPRSRVRRLIRHTLVYFVGRIRYDGHYGVGAFTRQRFDDLRVGGIVERRLVFLHRFHGTQFYIERPIVCGRQHAASAHKR